MPVPPEQAETAALLQHLAGRPPIETHISLVFTGTDTAWKLKKAVRLPFLDFTRAADRRHFLQRELDLNGPAAPGLYRDVVPVVRQDDGALALGTAGEAACATGEAACAPGEAAGAAGDAARPIDWVLRMAPVPPEDFLDAIALRGALGPALLDAIADAIAAYHGALPARSDVPPPMLDIARGNVPSALGAGLPEPDVRAWYEAMAAALNRLQPVLAARTAAGLVRRAHGDLHLGNLCLWQGHPVPFDALEFDETLATIDLAYDFAFLLMDLDQRVSRAAANRVLNRYVARTGDVGLVATLPAFLSLRAMVRAHVEARSAHAHAWQPYLRAARAYLAPAPAVAVALGGLPGTGKSTLARGLAPSLGPAPGALVLRSDEIRKRQHGVAPEQRLPQTAYSDAAHAAVLATLAEGVHTAAAGGHGVIADATFIDPVWRKTIAAAAQRAGVRFAGFWLQVGLAELERRIVARSGDASDATVAVLRQASRADPGPIDWHVVEAGDGPTALHAVRQQVQALTGAG